MSKTWKAVEREIAAIVGGTRNPVSGRQRGDKADIEHDWLSLEVKHRKSLPDWLHDAIDQAVQSMKGHQLPAVIPPPKEPEVFRELCSYQTGRFSRLVRESRSRLNLSPELITGDVSPLKRGQRRN